MHYLHGQKNLIAQDSQPLKIPPEEDCNVEICRGLTKDNTDKDATFLPFFLFKSTTPTLNNQ